MTLYAVAGEPICYYATENRVGYSPRDTNSWRKRRMWMVYLEFITSVVWAFLMIGVVLLWLLGLIIDMPGAMRVTTMLPNWSGVVLVITCMLQFAVALLVDSRFERGIGKVYYWMIWYPVVYWTLNVLTAVVAAPNPLISRPRFQPSSRRRYQRQNIPPCDRVKAMKTPSV